MNKMINTEIPEYKVVNLYFPSEEELNRFISQKIDGMKPIDVKSDYATCILRSQRRTIRGLLEEGGIIAEFSVNVKDLTSLTGNLLDYGAHVTTTSCSELV